MTDFDLVGEDNMEFVITDLVILNKKEKAPPKYTSVRFIMMTKHSIICG